MSKLQIGFDRWEYTMGGSTVLIRGPNDQCSLLRDEDFGGDRIDGRDTYFVSETLIRQYIENHFY